MQGGGYDVYRRLLGGKLTADAVIDEMEVSGLRGLGGAGFPVGRKWRIVREQQGNKALAVNIDEGEPGTFKDRYYLEQRPHCFLEGAHLLPPMLSARRMFISTPTACIVGVLKQPAACLYVGCNTIYQVVPLLAVSKMISADTRHLRHRFAPPGK